VSRLKSPSAYGKSSKTVFALAIGEMSQPKLDQKQITIVGLQLVRGYGGSILDMFALRWGCPPKY
jgi:hypothetical protein